MQALFVALGILVLALMALLLWFVPHLLQQQAARVAGETNQLREMLLDLLHEQEAVTVRQSQLGGSLSNMRDHLEILVREGVPLSTTSQLDSDLQTFESRIGEFQNQINEWAARRDLASNRQLTQDNEAWAHLVALLSGIQGRVGELTQDRVADHVTTQAGVMLSELEQEMQNLRTISEDIERLQWRLRQSLHERESSISGLRVHANGA